MRYPRSRQEEHDEQSKGKIPRVNCVCNGRKESSKDAAGRQRLLGVSSVTERRDRGYGDFNSHAAATNLLYFLRGDSVVADEILVSDVVVIPPSKYW